MKINKPIAVIELGYVGLPLSVAFAKKGYETIAYDITQTALFNSKMGFISDKR